LNNIISFDEYSIHQVHITKPQNNLSIKDGAIVDVNTEINLGIQNITTSDFGMDIAYKLSNKIMVYKESLIEIAEETDVQNDNLASEIKAEKERRLMLMADFENYKKRMETERATFAAIGNISLIQGVLEVFDDLQLAMSDENLNIDSAKQAIQGAQNKIQTATKIAGVEQVEVKTGDDFDKEKMEAVSTIPVQEEIQKGKVIAVISSAYKYVGREGIVKPAKVVVGK
jgi:molecular chaperone GrpE